MTKSDSVVSRNTQFKKLQEGLPPTADSGLFGLDLEVEDANIVVLEVPWDATTSYRPGTHRAPDQIRVASHQLDLNDSQYGQAFLSGISYQCDSGEIQEVNQKARPLVEKVIASWEKGEDAAQKYAKDISEINALSRWVDGYVEERSRELLKQDKLVAVLGGDHSCPLGLIKSLSQKYADFSILHIDAHHDLREAYEGFESSHASIMYNVLQSCKSVATLVSVGIRDYSYEEDRFAKLDERVFTFYEDEIRSETLNGVTFSTMCDRILSKLGKNVYISCDIDGFEPTLCPSTGTPVPGGLNWGEWQFLLHRLSQSGKKIIGFDLCEVGDSTHSNEWDANVGARVLYKLCGAAVRSNQITMAKIS